MDDQKPVSRRKLLGAGAAVAALTAGTALIARHKRTRAVSVPPGVKTSAAKRPNILLIMSDQERRWQDLPKELTWPAHERLFEPGTAFTNYHIHTTPCSPSRSTFYFGQHTQLTGMVVNSGMYFPSLNNPGPLPRHLRRTLQIRALLQAGAAP